MIEFAFPQIGPLKPPDPPKMFTTANLDTCFQQASTLWPGISRQSCGNALSSHFADGDPSKAIVLIQFYKSAVSGYVTPVCRRNGKYLPLRGAINVGGVSCYVNSLLVAMFSRMENFEPLLCKTHYGDPITDALATWLRLYVNLLRNGERVTDDIVAGLMAAAVAAGWATASPLSQQDTAEFFVFITEKLLMPLLVLRVDIAHAGREAEEFDHKLIKEQLLYLPVPGNEHDPPLLLEECFEIYFSNVINVSRHLSQPRQSIVGSPLLPALPIEKTDSAQSKLSSVAPVASSSISPESSPTPSLGDQSQRSSVSSMVSTVANWMNTADRSTGGIAPARRRSYSIMSLTSSPGFRRPSRFEDHPMGLRSSVPPVPEPPGSSRTSLDSSVFQRDESVDPLDEADPIEIGKAPTSHDAVPLEDDATPSSLPSYHQLFGFNDDRQAEARVRDMKRSLWTSNNEVMLPAWMFLQLMPFYADSVPQNESVNEPLEADEVAHNFQKARPVLGICLKRYYVDENGTPRRNNRRVIVPETINMPSFVADDSDKQQAFGKFKLVLESAVFHRGNSINSGHYVTLVSESVHYGSKNPSYTSSFSTDRSSEYFQPSTSPGYSEAQAQGDFNPPARKTRKWFLFDDMQHGGERVKEVNAKDVFDYESPYMLFYRMVSLEDDASQQSPSPLLGQMTPAVPQSHSIPSMASSRAPSPELGKDKEKDKKRKSMFFRGHKKKDSSREEKNYASHYREEKCAVM